MIKIYFELFRFSWHFFWVHVRSIRDPTHQEKFSTLLLKFISLFNIFTLALPRKNLYLPLAVSKLT